PERVGAVGGDGDRGPAVGKDEVEDREVVWRQVPQDVDVALDQAQVDAYGVDVEEVAQGAGGDQVADLLHCGRVAVGVVAHEDPLAALGQLDHRRALGNGRGQRFLDQHVLVGAQRRGGDLVVGAGRRRHRHRVAAGVVE